MQVRPVFSQPAQRGVLAIALRPLVLPVNNINGLVFARLTLHRLVNQIPRFDVILAQVLKQMHRCPQARQWRRGNLLGNDASRIAPDFVVEVDPIV